MYRGFRVLESFGPNQAEEDQKPFPYKYHAKILFYFKKLYLQ